ncbi:hypothetical protein GCM10027265_20440 [Jatrophihabitans fulvus]
MPEEQAGPQQPLDAKQEFGRWMGTMWLYTVLRFALFFALWGILLLVGLEVLFAAFVALVLSVPLSFVLLAGPRRAFTAQIEARVEAQKARRKQFDERLDPEGHENP